MTQAITEADLVAGAHELVHTCLAVRADDRVLILTDLATEKLADYIVRAASAVAGTTKVLVGDVDADFADAFATIEGALDALRPTVTVFAARDSGDLLAWEPRFGHKLDALGARHAQMPALDPVSLGIGMAVDYREVAAFSKAVKQRLAGTREVSISNALGTDILFTLDPQRPWIPLSGLYGLAGQRGRLPQGEVFCSPLSADGVIAASVLGYPFNAATGLLAQPVRFEIEKGRLADLSHPDADLAARLRNWFKRDEHAGRIGELAVGTNRGSTTLCGNLLFDENVPGCHIALGHPFGDWTGADWQSSVHVDLVVDRPTIALDGQVLILDGAYADAPSLSVPNQREEKRP